MSTLSWIIVVNLFGSVLSVSAAALIAWLAKPHWVGKLVSFAVGALLAAVFVEILPHAFGGHEHEAPPEPVARHSTRLTPENAINVDLASGKEGNPNPWRAQDAAQPSEPYSSIDAEHDAQEPKPDIELISLTILLGILAFFILEKLVIWRHCHMDECEEHGLHECDVGHDHGRSGMMIMIGDTFHNFLDGALVAAAFSASTAVGLATALAIIAHEIPQEVGDFIVLLNSGYAKMRAYAFNVLSSLAALLGGLIAWWSIGTVNTLQPYLLALGASSMIYVAIADLIPGLHKRPHPKDTLQQVVLILAGIGAIALPHALFPH